jgi:hypothetical protein
MLIIVMVNPIQFTMVSADPLLVSGAFLATKLENMGESAITKKLQQKRKNKKANGDSLFIKKGETKQQIDD